MENSDAYIWIGNYYYHYYWSDLSISLLSKLYLICAWTMRWQEKRRSGRNPSWNYNGQRHTTDPVSLSICLNHCYINGDNHWDHWYLLRFIGWFLDSISMHMYVCLFVWEMLMGQIYIDCGFPLLMMWTWIGWTGASGWIHTDMKCMDNTIKKNHIHWNIFTLFSYQAG